MLFLNEKTTNNAKFEVIFLKNIGNSEKVCTCARKIVFLHRKNCNFGVLALADMLIN